MGLWDVVGRPSRGLGAHSPTPSSPPAPPRPGAGAVPQPAADQGLRAAAAGDRQPEPPLRAVLQAGARRAVSGARPHSALCPGDPGASPSPPPSSSPPRGPLYFCMCPHPPLLAPAWAPECVYFVPNASLIVNLFFKKKEEKRIKKKKRKKSRAEHVAGARGDVMVRACDVTSLAVTSRVTQHRKASFPRWPHWGAVTSPTWRPYRTT